MVVGVAFRVTDTASIWWEVLMLVTSTQTSQAYSLQLDFWFTAHFP